MKALLITGAGSGLGRELALLFSQNNLHILLVGRSKDKLQRVKMEIEQLGGNADVIQADIRSYHEISAKINELSEDYSLQGVINNAGVGYFGPFVKMDENEIVEMTETNFLGTIYVTKAILPILEQQNSGFVMNIISTAGLRGKVNEAAYVASKFAVRGFTESLQKEYENTNIKFTPVYMGGMDTPFWENSDHIKDPSRLRSPKEVAEIIMSQLNEESIIIENRK
ncbi:SDR family NAD(P)-dependent oxidoreductase [Pseudoneobacillus rhizosphaerae]|uniref:Sepiapterin reductase n=1 Tax=Pseudoneobacillus rhizosphaerae TaxID=2880968 RepID=A0A9C7GD82_9BACI|nr:SDR family NAD(P)-dependent oxidoreductase [Pseudoneobacillus rhizosphaerae]CAG9609982.1 Sepiapterin reductase [Pseudoneobacillus rhizosphaerae]